MSTNELDAPESTNALLVLIIWQPYLMLSWHVNGVKSFVESVLADIITFSDCW